MIKSLKKKKGETIRKKSTYRESLLCDRLDSLASRFYTHQFFEQRNYQIAIALHHERCKHIPRSGERARIHFLLSNPCNRPEWYCFYESCLNDASIETVVVNMSDHMPASLFSPSVVIRYCEYNPYALRPHIIVYQEADDSVYEPFPDMRCAFIKKSGIRPVFFSNGSEVSALSMYDADNTLNSNAMRDYGQCLHAHAWRIVVPDCEVKESYRRCCIAGGEHVIVRNGMDSMWIKQRILSDLYAGE